MDDGCGARKMIAPHQSTDLPGLARPREKPHKAQPGAQQTDGKQVGGAMISVVGLLYCDYFDSQRLPLIGG